MERRRTWLVSAHRWPSLLLNAFAMSRARLIYRNLIFLFLQSVFNEGHNELLRFNAIWHKWNIIKLITTTVYCMNVSFKIKMCTHSVGKWYPRTRDSDFQDSGFLSFVRLTKNKDDQGDLKRGAREGRDRQKVVGGIYFLIYDFPFLNIAR